jgi:hypothetical protein
MLVEPSKESHAGKLAAVDVNASPSASLDTNVYEYRVPATTVFIPVLEITGAEFTTGSGSFFESEPPQALRAKPRLKVIIDLTNLLFDLFICFPQK